MFTNRGDLDSTVFQDTPVCKPGYLDSTVFQDTPVCEPGYLGSTVFQDAPLFANYSPFVVWIKG